MTSAYYEVMSHSNQYGLHELWNTPSMNVTIYYDTAYGTSANTTTMSLWEAGNMYAVRQRQGVGATLSGKAFLWTATGLDS